MIPIAKAVVYAIAVTPTDAPTAEPIDTKNGAAAGMVNNAGATKATNIRKMYLKYFISKSKG